MSCSGAFDIHPYDVNIKGETGINAKQMAIIEKQFANKDTLRVAFISDTHLWLSDAKDQVADVNKRNVALGQRLTFNIPEKARKRYSRISLFYEVGTCDLYIRSMFQDSSIPLKDILGLSIGLKFYTL
jgi:hypothetical protein